MDDNLKMIAEMESRLDQGLSQMKELQYVVDECQQAMNDYRQLFTYYGSEDWYRQLELDQAGLLPKHQERGVLSEDGIYNLILDCREMAEQLRHLAKALDQAIDQE